MFALCPGDVLVLVAQRDSSRVLLPVPLLVQCSLVSHAGDELVGEEFVDFCLVVDKSHFLHEIL